MEKDKLSPKKPRKALKVILDSSFLFIPPQFGIDVFEELEKVLNQHLEPIILSPTYKELQTISESGSTKSRQQATLALKFAQKCHQVAVEKGDNETHDDVIVRVASEMGGCVATNDRDLRKRLRQLNVPVVYLRQKSRFAVEGAI